MRRLSPHDFAHRAYLPHQSRTARKKFCSRSFRNRTGKETSYCFFGKGQSMIHVDMRRVLSTLKLHVCSLGGTLYFGIVYVDKFKTLLEEFQKFNLSFTHKGILIIDIKPFKFFRAGIFVVSLVVYKAKERVLPLLLCVREIFLFYSLRILRYACLEAIKRLCQWATRPPTWVIQWAISHYDECAVHNVNCAILVHYRYKWSEVRWNSIWRETLASHTCSRTDHSVFCDTRCSPLFHAKCCFISPHFLCIGIPPSWRSCGSLTQPLDCFKTRVAQDT